MTLLPVALFPMTTPLPVTPFPVTPFPMTMTIASGKWRMMTKPMTKPNKEMVNSIFTLTNSFDELMSVPLYQLVGETKR